MDIKLDIASTLLFAACLNCILFIGYSLLQKDSLRFAQKFWSLVYHLAIVVICLEHIITFSGYLERWPHFQFISTPFIFLFAPALYLSFRHSAKASRHDWIWHMIVPIVVLLIMIRTYAQSGPNKIEAMADDSAKDPVVFIIFFFLHFSVYAWLIIKQIGVRQKSLVENFANTKIENDLIAHKIGSVLVFFACSFPVLMVMQYISQDLYRILDRPLIIIFSFSAHTSIAIGLFKRVGINKESEGSKGKNLIGVEHEVLSQTLIEHLEKNKDYLEANLTLEVLAERIGTNRTTLSQTINGHLNTNFYELINNYRIEEVKRKMLNFDQDKYSLDHLAYESGFNSYVSFYRVFKRFTGSTPTRFLKQILK